MKRFLMGTFAAMALVAIMVPTIASATVQSHSFGANGTRFDSGRIIQVTVNAQCTAGEVLLVRATVTQDDAFAEGQGGILCTGNADAIPAAMRSAGAPFDAGAATVCSFVASINRTTFVVTDTKQTCATVTLSS